MVAMISHNRMLKNTPASNLNFRWWWYAILLGKWVLDLNFSQSLIVATIHSKQLFPWKLKLLRLLNVSVFQVF